jgi:hypothetical protein
MLSRVVECDGSRSSFAELTTAVLGSGARLVDVAGWLTDEIESGRVRVAESELPPMWPAPARYEATSGATSYRNRLHR